MTASPSPARRCTSMTAGRGDAAGRTGARGADDRHAAVRLLLGPAGDHRGGRRQRAQEPEGPRDRLRPRHPADRSRPQASDVCRQARRVQRADRASRRGRDAAAGHHRARHQCDVGGAERGNPHQRLGRLGGAVPSGISAARDRGDRAPHRHAADRRRLLRRRGRHQDASPRISTRSTAIPTASGCPGGTASARTCSTRSCASARWPTGSNSRCCRRGSSGAEGRLDFSGQRTQWWSTGGTGALGSGRRCGKHGVVTGRRRAWHACPYVLECRRRQRVLHMRERHAQDAQAAAGRAISPTSGRRQAL